MNEVCELIQSGQQATFYQSKEQGFIGVCLLNKTPTRKLKSETSRRIFKLCAMKNLKLILLFILCAAFTGELLADAWTQHYSKCYIVTKRYRAHANIRTYETLYSLQPCPSPSFPGCIYSCGSTWGCYATPYQQWTKVANGFDKDCSKALTSVFYSGYHTANGITTLRRGYAYAKAEFKKSEKVTWVSDPLTQAGCNYYYVPENIDTTIDRTGFSKTVFDSQVSIQNRQAKVDSFTGEMIVPKHKYYTSVIRVYVVVPNFNPAETEDEVGENSCFDLSSFTVLDSGSVALNGYDVVAKGFFTTPSVSTIDTDSGTIKRIRLGSSFDNYTYNIPDAIDTSLVSVITYADSYYDYYAEELGSSSKKEIEPKQTLVTTESNFSFKAYPISNHVFDIKLALGKAETGIINVVDINGRLIKTIANRVFEPIHPYQFNLNMDGYSSGLYFVNYLSNTKKETIRIVVSY